MQAEELNKDIILTQLTLNSNNIKEFGVKRIGLFGSYVRNQSNVESDIDFLVEFEPERKSYKNFIHLAYFLKNLFNSEIDLLTQKSLSPYLGPHILKEVEYVSFND
ncbi:MAG: nucleotidyltransferase family protein [Bacteroidales bacterium]|nr:nucleotidyltransferase family protein [Bacteroidales bacterium]